MNVHIMTQRLYSLIKDTAPGLPSWEEYKAETGAHSPLWDPETVYLVELRESQTVQILGHEALHIVLRRVEGAAASAALDDVGGFR